MHPAEKEIRGRTNGKTLLDCDIFRRRGRLAYRFFLPERPNLWTAIGRAEAVAFLDGYESRKSVGGIAPGNLANEGYPRRAVVERAAQHGITTRTGRRRSNGRMYYRLSDAQSWLACDLSYRHAMAWLAGYEARHGKF